MFTAETAGCPLLEVLSESISWRTRRNHSNVKKNPVKNNFHILFPIFSRAGFYSEKFFTGCRFNDPFLLSLKPFSLTSIFLAFQHFDELTLTLTKCCFLGIKYMRCFKLCEEYFWSFAGWLTNNFSGKFYYLNLMGSIFNEHQFINQSSFSTLNNFKLYLWYKRINNPSISTV